MKLFLKFTLIMAVYSCGQEVKQPPQSLPPALMYVFDASGSFKHSIPPDDVQIKSLANQIANVGGIVAFHVFGTPDSGSLVRERFLRATDLPVHPVYSDYIEHDRSCLEVKRVNDSLVLAFALKVSDAFKIRKKAARWSDLNGALWTSNNFFNEPGMNAYRPLLFINTDGHHEVGLDTTVVYSLIEPNITVWYVGIHKENAPPQWVPLADPGGLQYAIHNFIHQ